MGAVSGQVTFTVADTKVFIYADGEAVATMALPEADDDRDTLRVIVAGGETWTVHWAVPPVVAQLFDRGEKLPATAVSPDRVPAWASVVYGDEGLVAEADVGVSLITLAPVAIAIGAGDSVYQVTAGPSWRWWSLAAAGETIATIESDDGFVVHADRPVPMAVLALAATNGLAVAGRMARPRSLPARGSEDKAKAKFLNRYGRAADMARKAGHEVQYMSAWDHRADLYSWIECLRCGHAAATFSGVGGASKTTIAYQKPFGRLHGPILDGDCTGTRTL